MAESKFVIHYTHVDKEGGYVSSYTTPMSETVKFDTTKGAIDFDPLQNFIGKTFDFYVDGKFKYKARLDDVRPNEMGINAIHFTEIAKSRLGLMK